MKKWFLIVVYLTISSLTIANSTTPLVDSLNKEMWQQVFSQPREAIKGSEAIINVAKEENNYVGLAKTYAQKAVAYDLLGGSDSALMFFQKAITIQEQEKDSVGLAFSYNNLGLLFYAQYDYQPALKNLRISLALDRKINDSSSAAGALTNIGIILTYLDSMEQSMECYQEAYLIYKKQDNSRGISTTLSNMGKILFAKKEYEKALENYLKVALYYDENGGSPEAFSTSYNSLSNVYLKLNQLDIALEYATKDLSICIDNQLNTKRQFAYETLNEIYLVKKDFKQAYEYLKKYTNLRDSLLNDTRTKAMEEMQVKYETEKTESELLKVRLEKEKERLEYESEKLYFYGIATLLTLGLLSLIFGYRSKQKINSLLKEKNELNEAIIAQKEVLLGEVHHRVKNNLQLISSIVELQAMQENSAEAFGSLQDIQKRINAIAELHQFLYQGDDVEKVNVEQYLTSLANGLKASFKQEQKEIKITTHVAALSLDVKTAVPIGLMVNELITNSLKYAFKGLEKGEIIIDLQQQENKLILKVMDNGVGYESEKNRSMSFGMKMIKSLCRQLKAKWEVNSEKGVTHVIAIERFKIYE